MCQDQSDYFLVTKVISFIVDFFSYINYGERTAKYFVIIIISFS